MFHKNLKMIILAVACAFIVGAFGVPASSTAETTLIHSGWIPRQALEFDTILVNWAKEIEKNTNGRIKINMPAAPLGPTNEHFDMVEKGVCDIGLFAMVYKRNVVRLPQIVDIPFTAKSSEAASVALWRTHKKFFEAINEAKGVKILGYYAMPEITLESVKHPILSLDDLKGMKIGSVPGTNSDIVKALGATPMAAPGIKSFELLSKGTVDGCASAPLFAALALKHGRYVKHITLFPGGLQRIAFALLMRQGAWDDLTPEDKKLFENTLGEKWARQVGKKLDEIEKNVVIKEFSKLGVTFHKADDAFLAAAAERLTFIEKNWLEGAKSRGIDGPAALSYYKKTAAEVFSE